MRQAASGELGFSKGSRRRNPRLLHLFLDPRPRQRDPCLIGAWPRSVA